MKPLMLGNVKTGWLLLGILLITCLIPGCSSEAKLQKHLQRADRFFHEGHYEEAELEYRNVRQLDPNNAHALGQLGLIYSDQGRSSLAHHFLTQAKELDQNNVEVRLRLGFLLLATGELVKAREEALAILEKTPTRGDAQILLAQCLKTPEEATQLQKQLDSLKQRGGDSASLHLAFATMHFQLGDLDKAESAINAALAMDPNYDEAYHAQGNLYWKRGNLIQAEESLKKAGELSPARSTRRLKYVDFKVAQGDLHGARIILEGMNKEFRDFLPAYIRLAELALQEEDYEECESLVKTILSRDASNFDALLLSGRTQLLRGERTKAIDVFDRLTTLYAGSPQAHYHAGLAYLEINKPHKATASFQKALTLNPVFPEALLHLAQIDLRKGEWGGAIDKLRQLTVSQTKNKHAHLLLAGAYKGQGRGEEALGIYEQLEARHQQDPEIPFLRGMLLLEKRKRPEARDAFTKALSISETFFPALEQMIELQIQDKAFDGALTEIGKQMESRKGSPELHYLLAKVFLGKLALPEAEEALEQALELDPFFNPARLCLARLHSELGKDEKALTELAKILAKDPKHHGALTLKATIQIRGDKIPAACTTFEALLVNEPHSIPVLNNLAYLYAQHPDRLDRAYELARQARQLAPGNAQVADTLGWIQCRRGDYESALPNLEESAKAFPDREEMQLHLGHAYYMLCDQPQARTALQRAATKEADTKTKKEASILLQILDLKIDSPSPQLLSVLERRLKQEPKDPVALVKMAALHEAAGNPKQALEVWERARKQTPRSVFILTNVTRVYLQLNETARALELSRRAHILMPDHSELSYFFGKVAYDAKDHPWAMTLLETATALRPSDSERMLALARAYYSVGRIQEAESKAKLALQHEISATMRQEAQTFLEFCEIANIPTIDTARRAAVDLMLKDTPNFLPARVVAAKIAEHSGDIQKAREHYNKLLTDFPYFAPAKKRLAILYAQGPFDWKKSTEWAEQARSIFPEDSEITKVLGMALYHQGAFERSVKVLQESLRLRADDPELFYFLGMAQFHLKAGEESKRSLQQVLSLDASGVFAADARKTLQQIR